MSTIVHNAHDKTFRQALSHPNLAKQFFETHLPSVFRKKVDLSTLRLQKGSFIDAELAEHLTDLLYSVEMSEREGYLYLVCEHQSTPDELMAFRLLQYSMKIMQQHMHKHKTKKLPLVYPLVYYVGQKPATKFIPDLMDCFADPDLARHYFMRPFTLINLQKMSDDKILKNKALAGLELLQKHVYNRDMAVILDKMIEKGIFEAMLAESGEFFDAMLKYTLCMGELREPETFISKLASKLPEQEDNIMTMAEHFQQKGADQALLATAKKMLASGRLNPAEIAEFTGLTVEDVNSLAVH
mgnify:CR=1 FL=1